MTGKNLDDWADEQERPDDTVDHWFANRPELAEQVLAAREPGADGRPRFTFTQIEAWLVDEHAWPFRPKGVQHWMSRQ